MALLGINPVSQQRTAQAEQPQLSPIEKIMQGLQVANSVFGIAADYSRIQQATAQTELAEQRGQREQEAFPLVQAKSQADIDKIQADIQKTKKETEQLGIKSQEDLAKERKAVADASKAEIELKDAQDKFDAVMRGDPFVRRLDASTRTRVGQLAMAYSALDDLEKAAIDGVPIGRALGDNRATEARRRFVEGFGRAQSGGVISSDNSFKALTGIFGGGEIQNFEKMLPKPGDTPRVAREKIDNMREAIEIQIQSQGFGTADDWKKYIGRITRVAEPLKKDPSFPTSSEETQKQSEAAVGAISDIAKGIGAFLSGTPAGITEEQQRAFDEKGFIPPNDRLPIDMTKPAKQDPFSGRFQDPFNVGLDALIRQNKNRSQLKNTPNGKTVIPKR